MKKLILILLCLLAPVARADDVTGLYWNSVTGTFQALTKALGWKTIPDYETGSFPVNFTGARSVSVTFNYIRMGKQVTLQWPSSVGVNCTAANTFNSGSTDLPSSLRTSSTQGSTYGAVLVQNSNGVQTGMGVFNVTPTGAIGIQNVGATAFTSGNNCGFYQGAFTYTLQ